MFVESRLMLKILRAMKISRTLDIEIKISSIIQSGIVYIHSMLSWQLLA